MSLYGILFTASLNCCHSRQLTEASPFFIAENQIIRGCFLQLTQKVSSARKRSFDLATDNSFETTAFTNRFYRSQFSSGVVPKSDFRCFFVFMSKVFGSIDTYSAGNRTSDVGYIKNKEISCIFKCSTLQSIQYCFGT